MRKRKRNLPVMADPLWYKDAVIYQLHVKSFFDSNNDGVGDFPGLSQKLDYIQSLGVNAIWLLPFYPSPRRDDGYDIADYRGVHPDYGTLGDFKRVVAGAHARDMRVITDRLRFLLPIRQLRPRAGYARSETASLPDGAGYAASFRSS